MDLTSVQRIADAILYEGYLLYPYRPSALKNQQRFNFGVVSPSASGEASSMRTECLIEGEAVTLDVRVCCLQVISREFHRHQFRADGVCGGFVHVGDDGDHTWQEVLPREVHLDGMLIEDLLSAPKYMDFVFDGDRTCETRCDADDNVVGTFSRHRATVSGSLTIRAARVESGLTLITVEIINTTQSQASTDRESMRETTLLHSLVSTHTILAVNGGKFVSLLDPPESCAEAARRCNNIGTWPVLVGDESQQTMMLSAPIILYDYPQVAPESDGDYFDGTEIDEMLALRIMTLTDAEKQEMQSFDARARQILERTEAISQEHWQKLHGAIRHLKPVH